MLTFGVIVLCSFVIGLRSERREALVAIAILLTWVGLDLLMWGTSDTWPGFASVDFGLRFGPWVLVAVCTILLGVFAGVFFPKLKGDPPALKIEPSNGTAR